VIEHWLEQRKEVPGLRLVLFASLLKHEQLGLDKYQAGRIFVFGNALMPKDLQKLHESASHPLIDAYMEMMYALQGETPFTPPKVGKRGKSGKRDNGKGYSTGEGESKQSLKSESKKQSKSHKEKLEEGGDTETLKSLLEHYKLVTPDDIFMAVGFDVCSAAANGGCWGNMQLINALCEEYKVVIDHENNVDLGASLSKIVSTRFNHFNVVINGKFVYVKGDGDCAFRAVAKLLLAQEKIKGGEEAVVMELRQKSQKLMIANYDLWESMVVDTLASAARAHAKGFLNLGMGFGNQLAGLLLSHYGEKHPK
jgi:hypothetical protein